MAEFKKLRGNRVFLEMPKMVEDNKLYVDENTKEALQKEMVLRMRKLKVYAAGDLVLDFEKGDYVLVDPEALSKAKLIPLSEAKTVMMVSAFDIALVW